MEDSFLDSFNYSMWQGIRFFSTKSGFSAPKVKISSLSGMKEEGEWKRSLKMKN